MSVHLGWLSCKFKQGMSTLSIWHKGLSYVINAAAEWYSTIDTKTWYNFTINGLEKNLKDFALRLSYVMNTTIRPQNGSNLYDGLLNGNQQKTLKYGTTIP